MHKGDPRWRRRCYSDGCSVSRCCWRGAAFDVKGMLAVAAAVVALAHGAAVSTVTAAERLVLVRSCRMAVVALPAVAAE